MILLGASQNYAYLTVSLARAVKETLDEAFAAFGLGMDRGARAYFGSDAKEQLSPSGEALAYYATSQRQSQQAKTMLLRRQ
jgi:hypothetical protein